MSRFHLVSVGSGALALSPRPKLKDLPALRTAGMTHVVTLLTENEGALQVGAAATRAGLSWIWIPLHGAAVPDSTRTAELRQVLRELCELIEAGNKLFVHCSAGIHRTGMFGYALLRRLGLNADAARAKLAELRQVTAEGVGLDRLAWGDALVSNDHPQAP